jgi:hypothetical protein
VQRSDNYELHTFTARIELHGQWGPRLRKSVHRGCTEFLKHSSCLPGILLGSRVFLALSWTMLEKVPGDVASWHQLYVASKPLHVGVDVDGLA